MMMQLGLFDALHALPIVLPVEPYGSVVQGDVDEFLYLPHPRLAWNRAEIELHRHDNGLWMWSTGWNCDNGGGGYRVGPKWGKFAQTRNDALFYAVRELTARFARKESLASNEILAWARSL